MPRATAIPAAERRAHAVRVLLELARATAPDQISTAAIAARMGVSHAALFRHFPSREAIWAAAVAWATQELEARFAANLALEDLPPLQRLQAMMASHAALLRDHPGLVRMLFAELQRPGSSPACDCGRAFMQRFAQRLTELIREAQARSELAPDLGSDDLASLLIATQQGLMLQALAHDSFDSLAERSGHSMELLLRAACGRRAPGGVPAAAPAG